MKNIFKIISMIALIFSIMFAIIGVFEGASIGQEGFIALTTFIISGSLYIFFAEYEQRSQQYDHHIKEYLENDEYYQEQLNKTSASKQTL